MPIIDYHSHLSQELIAKGKVFQSLTEIWLSGDHYKWRTMRGFGIDEAYITGSKTDEEKFLQFAKVVPSLIGNPIYHWVHMELATFFQIYDNLNEDNALEIYNNANQKLKNLGVHEILDLMKVTDLCTTDDPLDSLEFHQIIHNDETIKTNVLPTFRPDKVINIDRDTFLVWLVQLEELEGKKINTIKKLKNALIKRIDFFHEMGCRLADHALDQVLYSEAFEEEVELIFQKGITNEVLSIEEIAKFKTHLILFFAKEYYQRQWTMQLHIGALRNASTKNLKRLGPDTGYDSMNDYPIIQPLKNILNNLDSCQALPKTIIYPLNPSDFDSVMTLLQSFQTSDTEGKLQFGSAWWFLDNIEGIKKQLSTLARHGNLSTFIGMLTDSRSFLSFSRHDYFRRILCDFIGEQVKLGYYPKDIEYLGQMVQNICYNNAKKYLGL